MNGNSHEQLKVNYVVHCCIYLFFQYYFAVRQFYSSVLVK